MIFKYQQTYQACIHLNSMGYFLAAQQPTRSLLCLLSVHRPHLLAFHLNPIPHGHKKSSFHKICKTERYLSSSSILRPGIYCSCLNPSVSLVHSWRQQCVFFFIFVCNHICITYMSQHLLNGNESGQGIFTSHKFQVSGKDDHVGKDLVVHVRKAT